MRPTKEPGSRSCMQRTVSSWWDTIYCPKPSVSQVRERLSACMRSRPAASRSHHREVDHVPQRGLFPLQYGRQVARRGDEAYSRNSETGSPAYFGLQAAACSQDITPKVRLPNVKILWTTSRLRFVSIGWGV